MFLIHLKEPETDANILVKKERLLEFVSSSHFQKEINRLNAFRKMHEIYSGDCWMTVTEGQKCQVLYMLVSADSQKFSKLCLKLLGPTKHWVFY